MKEKKNKNVALVNSEDCKPNTSGRTMSLRKEIDPKRCRLNIPLDNFDKDVRPLLEPLVDKANEILFIWETFPINLPERISGSFRYQDVFVEPQFNEDVRRAGLSSNGQRKYFSKSQLETLRSNGEFSVESVDFPGHFHRWILSRFLVKGTEKVRETFLNDISRAVYLIVITARRRFYSQTLSIASGLNYLYMGVMGILDMIVGLPAMEAVNLEAKLQTERSRYLVAELKTPNSQNLRLLYEWVKSHENKFRESNAKPPVAIIYKFKTPSGVDIDLTLCKREILRDAKPYLFQILTSAMQGWIPERRKDILTRTRNSGYTEDFIESAIKKEIEDEYLERVCKDVMHDVRLNRLGKEIPALLVNQVKTYSIIEKSIEEQSRSLDIELKEVRENLEKGYPILSKIVKWMDEKLAKAKADYVKSHQWDAHTKSAKTCEDLGLLQSAYFLRRDLSFRRDRETTLKDELEKVQEPLLDFTFNTRIWFPKNWVVMEKVSENGSFEVIPTVISNNESIAFRPVDSSTEYKVIKKVSRTNTTRYPLWRWTNFALRTWSWFWNALFFLGIIIPWCSPVSFRALCYQEPFFPDYEVNPANGKLRKKKDGRTLTMCFRIRAIWKHIEDDMELFENSPDNGLLPKTFARYIKYIVNYFIKGFCGTVIVSICMTLACLFCTGFSILFAVTAPVHIPLFSIVFHLLGFFFFDFEGKTPLNSIFWNIFGNIFLLGFGQIFASVVALIGCPIMCLMMGALAFVRRGLRNAWDSIIFQIIRKRVRIPVRDDFLSRRISGPGLAAEHFYQINPEQALIAVKLKMDKDHLLAYQNQTRKEIMVSENVCRSFFEKHFGPFGFRYPGAEGGPGVEVQANCHKLLKHLDETVERSSKHLSMNVPSHVRAKFRLSEKDLRTVLQHSTKLVQIFYEENILSRLNDQEKILFWDLRNLPRDDWLGLSAKNLREEICDDIVVPLQEVDKSFSLQTQNLNLSRLIDMAFDAEWHGDMEVARVIKAPRSATSGDDASPTRFSYIDQPKVPIEAFNPMNFSKARELIFSSTAFWTSLLSNRWILFKFDHYKNISSCKLDNPLPQPHPLEICVLIYLRDSPALTNPININDFGLTSLVFNLTEQKIFLDDDEFSSTDSDEATRTDLSQDGKYDASFNQHKKSNYDKVEEADECKKTGSDTDDDDGPPSAEPLLSSSHGQRKQSTPSKMSPVKESYSTLV